MLSQFELQEGMGGQAIFKETPSTSTRKPGSPQMVLAEVQRRQNVLGV